MTDEVEREVPPPVSPATVPSIKVEINCETLEEFLEFFGPLMANAQPKVETVKVIVPNIVPEPKNDPEPQPEKEEAAENTQACRSCDVVLVVGENWYPSQAKISNYRCKTCQNQYYAERKKAKESGEASPKTNMGRPRTRKCNECGTNETPKWRIHKGKQVCDACKTRFREAGKSTEEGEQKQEETKPKQPRRRNLAWTTKPTGKGKGKKKASKPADPKPTQEQPKTRPVNDMFTAAYDAMATAIASTSMADTNSILETINVTEAEQEMATEIVMKLMRAAAGHAKNEFNIGTGENPTLLCFSAGATLPSLDILRAY